MEMPAELVEKEFWIHLRETERLIKLGEIGNERRDKKSYSRREAKQGSDGKYVA